MAETEQMELFDISQGSEKQNIRVFTGDAFKLAKRGRGKRLRVAATIGSPPYPDKGGRYKTELPHDWSLKGWHETMRQLTHSLLEYSEWVIWVVADTVKGGREYPSTDKLRCLLHDDGVCCETPFIWLKNQPPNRMLGDAQSHWSAAYERILVFKRQAKAPFYWEPNSTPKRYKSGGDFHQRNAKGERVKGSSYPQGDRCRPRNYLKIRVGGGHMGLPGEDDKDATGGRAPFPILLPYHLLLSYSAPGDVILDPFGGTGTTLVASLLAGRHAIGFELDPFQVAITNRRVSRAVRNYQRYAAILKEKHDKLLEEAD